MKNFQKNLKNKMIILVNHQNKILLKNEDKVLLKKFLLVDESQSILVLNKKFQKLILNWIQKF